MCLTLISHRAEALRNPNPLLSRKHPGSAAAPRLRGLASESPGEWLLCRQERWLRSQVATAQALDVSSFLVASFVTLPRISFVFRSVSAAVVQRGSVVLPQESATSQCAVSSMARTNYGLFPYVVSLHTLHFRSPSPRRGQLFTNLLLQASENVQLCQNMDVRNSGPMSTSWMMMMSRFGWQWSETLLCK